MAKKEEKENTSKKDTKKNSVKTEKKKTVKKEKKTTEKQGYFKAVKTEMSKVKWPAAKDVIKYSVATLVFCVFLGLFFEALNIIMTFIKGLF